MARKQLFNIFKVIISLGLLGFLISQIDITTVFDKLQQADLSWLMAAIVMVMLGLVLKAWRWQILLNAIDIRVSLRELTSIYFIGALFNNVLPTGIGGDAIRVVELNRHTQKRADTVTSVLVDRFLGLSALQAIGLIALLFDWSAVPPTIAYLSVAIFLAGILIGVLLINRALYQFLLRYLPFFKQIVQRISLINSLFESFQGYPLPALGKAYAVSLLFNLSLVTMNIFAGMSVGVDATIIQFAIFVPITSLVLLLPSFAGLGVREGTYITLFMSVGVPEETAFAMSIIGYAVGNICTGMVGGVIYLVRNMSGLVDRNPQIESRQPRVE